MRCEKCGKVNVEGAQVCENCGRPLGVAADAPSPQIRRPFARWALTSALCGIVAPFTLGLSGLVGLATGIVALIQITRSQGRLRGEWLAIVGIVFSTGTITYMAPVSFRARDKALTASGECNLKQLALGMAMYRQDWDGHFPMKHNWCDVTFAHIIKNENIYVCPKLPRERCGYGYNEALAGLREKEVGSPPAMVMLFDAEGGWNSAGGVEIVEPRHDYGVNIAFVDGSCRWTRSYSPHAITWDPSWTQSHPPSEQWTGGRPPPGGGP